MMTETMIVEYRHKDRYKGDERCEGCRRNEMEMVEDLSALVREVNEEGIPMELREEVLETGSEEMNDIIIEGMPIREVLEGLTIVSSCNACGGGCETCATPNLEWIEEKIEDIPDQLLKMAISKRIMDHVPK